jgi:catechol 2,3-dioxygenase-like lactoylglutathione lyase family enzyme
MLKCTHFVLYVRDIDLTKQFYIDELGCKLREGLTDDFLSISVGGFIINFYKIKDESFGKNYSQGLAHIGLEVDNRHLVDSFHKKLNNKYRVLEKKLSDFTYGPYRFYLEDPDGYVVGIHTWEGSS